MLFGDAHVERLVRMRLGELVDAGAAGHRGGDRTDTRVGVCKLGERFAEDVLVGGRSALRLLLFAGDHVELGDTVILVRAVFGRGIALALLRHDMDQHRALFAVADVLEHGNEVLEIVPVDRPNVIEPQLFEQSAAGRHAARVFFCLLEPAPHTPAELLGDLRGHGAQPEILARGHHAREICRQPADRRRDRHVVVVQNDDQPVACLFGVVHRLIGHPRAHRAVADHGDATAGLALHLVRHGEAERSRDRCRAVRRAEGIVFAFGALGEAAEASALPQRADAIAPPGQDLVRVALVADIPDELVLGRVENIVDRRGQFDHAQPRSQMAPRLPDGVDHFGAQFVGQLAKLVLPQLAQIFGGIDRIQQRRLGAGSHKRGPTPVERNCR